MKSFKILVLLLASALFMIAGCAKEAVKPDEPVKVEKPKTLPPQRVENSNTNSNSTGSSTQTEDTSATAATIEPAKDTNLNDDAELKKAFATIYFDLDHSELNQDARESLTKSATVMLKKKTALKVRIEGHCDERGSAEYNLALGERRAKSALQYLLTMGVPAAQLSVVSYGKEKPAVIGDDEFAWSKNRRAEFVIIK